ncbi:MAG: DNA helicase PcrA [Actinomycetota bacterium]
MDQLFALPGDPKPADALLEGLNPQQRAAVEHRDGPLLLVAGAGSGKTKVLTSRIAHLIKTREANPLQILAITFTNKAAREMRERVEHLLGDRTSRAMWVLTFHSACGRILRQDGHRLGFTRDFTIYDSGDTDRLVGYILKDLDLDPKRFPVRQVRNGIGRAKDAMMDEDAFASHVEASGTWFDKKVAEVYRVYQQRLREANAMDFDDMILNTVHLLTLHEDVRMGYADRFRHVLIDEFQDTNAAQFRLVELLAGEHRNICAVGDADQSIYAFRGADYRNLGRFEEAFGDTTVITLEQNYRSTQAILSAANSVIANNRYRQPKSLWTEGGTGRAIVRFTADSDGDEALFVAQEIERLRDQDQRTFNDIAVFYRTNAQSRAFEEVFTRFGIPYLVVGALKFYDRKEVKDALAYLRTIANPADEVSFKRIVNEPKRGIGATSLARLESFARSEGITLAEACERVEEADIGGRARSGLAEFAALMRHLREMDREGHEPHVILEVALDKSGYLSELQADRSIEAQGRIENLQELVGVAESYAREFVAEPNQGDDERNDGGLRGFLEQVALVSETDDLDEGDGRVTIMTLHNAKGLEFPVVFLTGLEEMVFPHQRSMTDPEALEEERRLCYVGITRAREQLYLTHAYSRAMFGSMTYNPASRFLSEIPAELCEDASVGQSRASARASDTGRRFQNTTPTGRPAHTPVSVQIGDEVRHERFGQGVVLEIRGVGGDQQATIHFAESGTKRLLLAYAPLTKA